jgi:hypothetical protein
VDAKHPGFGWPLDGQDSEETVRWLRTGEALLGASQLIVRSEMANLETVYVEIREQRLVVSDRGETAEYLERGDSMHSVMSHAVIARVCRERGAYLVAVPDMWPHITVNTHEVATVANAIETVADAIDHVFASSNRFAR